MKYDGWKVLVVEDEYDSMQTISLVLKYHGIDVVRARNGKECLHTLETLHPTAVVMDLMMPELDGWETLAQIRANHQTAKLPVVAVTAYYSIDVEEEAHKAGFDAFFGKPVKPASFVKELAEVVGR